MISCRLSTRTARHRTLVWIGTVLMQLAYWLNTRVHCCKVMCRNACKCCMWCMPTVKNKMPKTMSLLLLVDWLRITQLRCLSTSCWTSSSLIPHSTATLMKTRQFWSSTSTVTLSARTRLRSTWATSYTRVSRCSSMKNAMRLKSSLK